ncbi:MAG: hypothetical protein ACI310_02670 [Bacilli bacterium]
MKEKNKNILIGVLIVIIITLLGIITLVLTGTIKLKNENNIENEDNNIIENNSETNNEISWTDYLLTQHILDAKMTRIRSKDLGDTEDINKTITIDPNDLKIILSKMKDNKLIKTYSLGVGGPERDFLQISYEKNDNKYEFQMINGRIILDKADRELVDFFDNKNYEEKNIEYKDKDGSFYYYNINGYDENIFNEYIK